MTVHFICRGNVYRSRLAETYFNSKKLENYNASSSGIAANRNLSGIISWYAQRLIQKEKLQEFEKPSWQQTTKELLMQNDLIVFMNKDIYDFCVLNFDFNKDNFKIWDIPDLINVFHTQDVVSKTDNTFFKIKAKVDELIEELTK